MARAKRQKREIIHVLLMHRGSIEGKDSWVAQCLDYDRVAQGYGIKKAKQAFALTLTYQVKLDIERGRKPLEQFKRAPQEYWDMWNQAEKLADDDLLQELAGQQVNPAVYSSIPTAE